MKRATREWLTRLRSVVPEEVDDILDSDARQRAEIRDLRARLAKVRELLPQEEHDHARRHCSESGCLYDVGVDRALDLKNKNWRKP